LLTKIRKRHDKDYIKKADKGLRMLYEKMPLGKVILLANGGSNYKKLFENFKNDVKSKVKSGAVVFSQSPQSAIRQPTVKRRTLMKRRSV
jgi:hypothetical protein